MSSGNLWLTSIQMAKSNGNYRKMPWQYVERENICWKLVFLAILLVTFLGWLKRDHLERWSDALNHLLCLPLRGLRQVSATVQFENGPLRKTPTKKGLPFELNCPKYQNASKIKKNQICTQSGLSPIANWLSMTGLTGRHAMKNGWKWSNLMLPESSTGLPLKSNIHKPTFLMNRWSRICS